MEKTITKIHFAFLGFAIFTIWLLANDKRFIGQYTNTIIGLVFLSSGIILFGITKSRIIKIYSGLIAIPTLLSGLSLLLSLTQFVLPALVGYLLFAAPLKKEIINDEYNLEIHEGGLLAPPTVFYLTKKTCLIFDKQIRLSSSHDYYKISKLEVISFKENDNIVCRVYNDEPNNQFLVDTLYYTNYTETKGSRQH